MSIDYSMLAQPKGKTRKAIKAKHDREDAAKLKAFRDAVWARERQKTWPEGEPGLTGAKCQHCGAFVYRSVVLTGEVHHRISRRHKATRYDPDNGVLLCNHLVNNCHAKAEAGLITV